MFFLQGYKSYLTYELFTIDGDDCDLIKYLQIIETILANNLLLH
jgi:hypothetical protein